MRRAGSGTPLRLTATMVPGAVPCAARCRAAGLAAVVLLLAVIPLHSAGSQPELPLHHAFREANEDYREGRYEEAARRYGLIVQRGLESGALYYNLGNALLKSGRTGEALWAYLKAATLIPRDPDLLSNLAYTVSLLPAGERVSVHPPRLIRVVTLGGRLTTGELACGWIGLLWIASACWAVSGWWRTGRPIMRAAAWGMSVAGAVALIALVTQSAQAAIPKAVTISNDVQVRYAPQEGGTTHFALPEGAVVRVLQRHSGWIQLRRADGRAGWAPEASLKAL